MSKKTNINKIKSTANEIVSGSAKDQTKSVLSSIIDFFVTSPLKTLIFGLLGIGSVAGVTYTTNNSNKTNNKFKLKESALIIEESKKIAKLFTMSYYTEVVIDTNKVFYDTSSSYISNLFSDENKVNIDSTIYELTIIANGTAYAGNDLSAISKSDIKITDSSCTIDIQNSKIISTVINPSNFNIFIDEGEWKPEEVQKIKSFAVKKVNSYALNSNILEKANKRTEKLIVGFIKSLGFDVVNVNFIDQYEK
jgi:hypothetical protein